MARRRYVERLRCVCVLRNTKPVKFIYNLFDCCFVVIVLMTGVKVGE